MGNKSKPQSFVASALLGRFAPRCAPPAQSSFEGAALFADISGYTALTRRLCDAGEEGLEELSGLLNRSFAAYVDCVAEHEGHIANFAGDGFLAYWSAEGRGPERAATLALACADRLRHLQINTGGLDEVHLHVGVAAGPLWAALLGSDFASHLLLGGQAVQLAAAAAQDAAAAQVAVDSTARSLVFSAIYTGQSTNGRGLLAHCPTAVERSAPRTSWQVPTAALMRLVPRIVVERGFWEEQRWLAELRFVSCLFVRIDGLTEYATEGLERYQQLVIALDETTARYGARGRLAIDDKGLIFIALFGTPLNAHPDDAARALRVAAGLRQRILELGLVCGIGVASGKTFCGTVGNEKRREYVAISDAMNLAARLMSTSSGAILCDTVTYSLARASVSLSAAGRQRFKGAAAEIDVYRLDSAEEGAPECFVGRSAEIALIESRVEQLRAGQGGVILVVASAGLGKTGLISRGLRSIESAVAPRLLKGAAEASEYQGSFGAWQGVFRQLLGAPRTSSRDTLRSLLEELLGPEQFDLLPLFNAVLSVDYEESAVTAHLSGQSRVDATLRVLSQVLGSFSSGLVILLEDGHWMDSASWRLAEYVAAHCTNLLLIITVRPQPRAERPALQELPGFVQLTLSPLTRSDIEALVKEQLQGQVSSEVFDLIEHYAAGNPLAAHEALHLFRESSRIGRVGNSWQVLNSDAPRDSSRSVSIQAMVAGRVDRLSRGEQLTLKVASVIGGDFSSPLVRQVHPLSQDANELDEQLRRLVGLHFLVHDEQLGQFKFRHELIRDAAYQLLLFEQRKTLHAAVGEALEEQLELGMTSSFARLVHHWSLAKDADRTRKYANNAAEQAMKAGAFTEAVAFLNRCVELEDRQADLLSSVRWRRLLSEAACGLGDMPRRRQHAEAALELAGAPLRKPALETGLAVAKLLRQSLRTTAVYPHSERTLALEIARAHAEIAGVNYFANDAVGLLRHTISAIDYAERAEPTGVLARGYAQMSVLGFVGFDSWARRYLERAFAVADASNDLSAKAFAHMISSLYFVGRGEWAGVEEHVSQSQAITERLSDFLNWGNAQVIRFWMHYYLGQWAAAETAAELLLVRARELDNQQQVAWALRCRALVFLNEGENDKALTLLQSSLDIHGAAYSEAGGDINELAPTWGAIALARYRLGQAESAYEAARLALQIASRASRPTGHAALAGWLAIAEVLSAAQQRKADSAVLELTLELRRTLKAHQNVFSMAKPAYYLWEGRFAALSGKPRRAKVAFAQGLTLAEQLGIPEHALLQRELEQLSAKA